MIDDQEQVKVLMQQMEAALPIPATLTSRLVRALRDQGKVFHKREVFIHSIFYSGDEGGISCAITLPGDAKEVVVVSLTHLRVSPKHPLGEAMRAYQQARTTRLARQGW
jgi:hypothetical protein